MGLQHCLQMTEAVLAAVLKDCFKKEKLEQKRARELSVYLKAHKSVLMTSEAAMEEMMCQLSTFMNKD